MGFQSRWARRSRRCRCDRAGRGQLEPAERAMMTRLLILALCLFAGFAPAQPASTQSRGFGWVDIYLDPHGKSLAAYQLEFIAPKNAATLVGIEGGQHPAFKEPPYYDPAALNHNRVILAAFSTDASVPTTRTHVARLHMQFLRATRD